MLALRLRRYGRQTRLPEIGEAGQTRLCDAKVVLGAEGFARTIEERYVRGFGATPVDGEGDDGQEHRREPHVAGLAFENEAAREVGEGALRALASFKTILEREP
jgi:hypothetical protein